MMPNPVASGHSATPRFRKLRRFGLCAALGLALVPGLPVTAPASAHLGAAAYGAGARYSYGPVFEWIVLDADNGQVLGQQNADALTYPASLTKMMTLYLTFEALNQGRITLDQPFYVSEHAATRAPSRIGLSPGERVTVRELILAIVTKSANDAAATLAENLGGSEANFAGLMTAKARQLGMDHTWFANASGLPDPNNRTTARDIARLALALYQHFPREYRYFDTRAFDFRGEIVHGHNHLLDWYQGADGIKTGFVNASGFNLAASAVRNGHRLIGVVLGGRTWHSRDLQMASLLDQGFAALASRPAQPQTAPVAVASAVPPVPTAPAAIPQAPVQPALARAAAPLPVATAAVAESGPRASLVAHVAANALRHLAPVGRAEAAPMRQQELAGHDDWAIQLGAFHGEAAAMNAARHAERLGIARGKPPQILPAGRHAHLYRARLLHFTPKAARAACAELHRHGIACAVVPGGSLKVASQ